MLNASQIIQQECGVGKHAVLSHFCAFLSVSSHRSKNPSVEKRGACPTFVVKFQTSIMAQKMTWQSIK